MKNPNIKFLFFLFPFVLTLLIRKYYRDYADENGSLSAGSNSKVLEADPQGLLQTLMVNLHLIYVPAGTLYFKGILSRLRQCRERSNCEFKEP